MKTGWKRLDEDDWMEKTFSYGEYLTLNKSKKRTEMITIYYYAQKLSKEQRFEELLERLIALPKKAYIISQRRMHFRDQKDYFVQFTKCFQAKE